MVEQQLAATIQTARQTYDEVTHRNYVADSGAVVVMEAKTGRIVAMASQPTYDPSVWVGGISQKQLARLYSEKAGTPLLGRATQGQFAPGSTWKPIMAAGALNNGFTPDTRLNCSSCLQVGNRWFKNYESAAYGYIGFDQALQLSCNTFFYRVGLNFWQQYGSDVDDVKAKDPLVSEAKAFGFGSRTGIDLPGEAPGRIADRAWKLDVLEVDARLLLQDRPRGHGEERLPAAVRARVLPRGQPLPRRRRGELRDRPGRHDRHAAAAGPRVRRDRPTAARSTRRGSPRRSSAPDGTVLKRFQPVAAGQVPSSAAALKYVDTALLGTPKVGTLAWKFTDFPLDQVHIRGKTGSAEVYGKQSTSWVATYDENYVVVMMVSQGGTGSGTSGPRCARSGRRCTASPATTVHAVCAAIPGVTPPAGLPTFMDDGSILPPGRSADSKGD